MRHLTRLGCLVALFVLLAPSASAQTVSWTIKPKEKVVGGVAQGLIECTGSATFAAGTTQTIGVFAVPKNGGVVYRGTTTVTPDVSGTSATYSSTVSNDGVGGKLPNDNYWAWTTMMVSTGSGAIAVCTTVEGVTITGGMGAHAPQATVTFTPVNNMVGKVTGAGTYTITGAGWKKDLGASVNLLWSSGGALIQATGPPQLIDTNNGTFTAAVNAPAGTYNVIALYSVQNMGSTEFQFVGSNFTLVTVK